MNAAAPAAGGMAYTTWKLFFPLLDDKNQVIEMIEGVQELYVGPAEFIVRVTREMDGATARYEDRGAIARAARSLAEPASEASSRDSC